MKYHPLKLGVNIDHVATLRQARGVLYPEPMEAARLCEAAGAHGITVHLREDRRHIQDHDVRRLRRALKVGLNLEMANTPAMVDFALEIKPAEVCLVPEKRRELTTEGGLDVISRQKALRRTVAGLLEAGMTVSLFIDPDKGQLEAAAAIGAPVVELHTGAFCNATGAARRRELKRLVTGARVAHGLGLQVNAGHGISLETIASILEIPFLHTLNIGHSIVARSVMVGMRQAVSEMLKAMAAYRGLPV